MSNRIGTLTQQIWLESLYDCTTSNESSCLTKCQSCPAENAESVYTDCDHEDDVTLECGQFDYTIKLVQA